MFILDTDQIPTHLADLTRAVEASLRKWIELPAGAACVTAAGSCPNVDQLSVDVSSGRIDPSKSLPFEANEGELEAGLSIAEFTIIGQPVMVSEVPTRFDLRARGAVFAYARRSDRKLIAMLRDADHGEVSIHLGHRDLETAALLIAGQLAGEHIAVQKVEVALTSVSATEVKVLLTITAKKFVTAIIRVSARVRIDEQMVARASHLTATGEGMVGKIAVGILLPQLQKLENVPLPLLAFPLGKVKLAAVEIHTEQGLRITAVLGGGHP